VTTPKITRNKYCTDPEDRVIPWSCPCCVKCWLFVASKDGKKNGRCPFNGPFDGYTPAPGTDLR
jgi:hypothetical protein